MNILIVSANYYPEPAGVAPIATELAEDLAALGHEVTALTAFPSYPERKIREPYRGKCFMQEKIRGVNVLRTWMHVRQDPSPFWRVVSFTSFIVTSLLGSLRLARPDAIICLSSPMPVGLTARLLSLRWHCPLIYNAQDLLIEASLQAGYIRPGWFLRRLYAFERFILQGAARITVICPGFEESMLAKGFPRERIQVIPNWIDVEAVQPGPRMNRFREEENLGEGFIFMHAGNIGLIHGHEYVIEAAEITKDRTDLLYCYLGMGLMKPRLERMVSEKGLPNVRFLPLRPREDMPLFLPAADCHLVSLDQGMRYSLPSKLATIMAAGRPVVGMMDEDTDAAQVIVESGCGLIVPPRNPEKLAQAILTFYENAELREQMGRAGRLYAEKHFNRKTNTARYDRILHEIVN